MRLILKIFGHEVIRTQPDLTEAEVKKRISNWKQVYGNKAEVTIIKENAE